MDTRSQSGLGAGIILGAVGAILYYAVTAEVAGIDIDVVGAILMIAGGILAVVGLISAVTSNGHAINRTTETHRTGDGVVRHERVDAGAVHVNGLLSTILMVLLILVLLSILL